MFFNLMFTIMKRSIAAIVVCIAFSFHGCQEAKVELKTPISEKESYKIIGQEIPFDTGMEWIEYYKLAEYNKKKNLDAGRIEVFSSYNVSASEITTMMQSTPDFTGIAFHYG